MDVQRRFVAGECWYWDQVELSSFNCSNNFLVQSGQIPWLMENDDFLARPMPLIPIYFEHHAQIIFKNKPLTSFSFKLIIIYCYNHYLSRPNSEVKPDEIELSII